MRLSWAIQPRKDYTDNNNSRLLLAVLASLLRSNPSPWTDKALSLAITRVP